MVCSRIQKVCLVKMSLIGLMTLIGIFCGMPERAFAEIEPDKLPLTEPVLYIDRDNDGYGVAAPQGPDADDNDPTVNTYSSAIAKYGSVENLLHHLGYYPTRIFYNDTQPETLQPGDLVIYRQGVYTGKYPLGSKNVHGTASQPIIILAMPGEKVSVQASSQGITIWESSYLVWDGFEVDGSVYEDGYGEGVKLHLSQNLTLKNLYIHHHGTGIHGFQDLHDLTIEDCVVSDQRDAHGIYLGARDLPNTNITVRGCRLYRNERHGFQHNGRVTNLIVEQNIAHSNDLGGLSLIEGMSDSIARNNLIFNNNKQGIILYDYDDSTPGILPYDQNNNLIENNLIWGGKYSWNGQDNPTYYPAILFNDATEAQQVKMENNVIRNNILVMHSDVVLSFRQRKLFTTTVIKDNIIYNPERPDRILELEEGVFYDFDGFQQSSPFVTGNRFEEPDFADVSVDYYTTPERFDFTMGSGSVTTCQLFVTIDGTGSGYLVSEPAGIDCGDVCTGSFSAGSSVTLAASPAAGSTFDGWSGACEGQETCELSLNCDTNVTAIFTTIPVVENHPPVAVDDTYSLVQTDTLRVGAEHGVLANDSDEDSDQLYALLLEAPLYGTLTLSDNGAFTYTHGGGSAGSDMFEYEVLDGQDGRATATVYLTITPNTGGKTRVTKGLVALYNFTEGSGTTVHDMAGTGTPLDLTITAPAGVKWLSDGGLVLISPTLIASSGATSKITQAVQQTNELTLEAWVKPANLTQDGPARIVSISKDAYSRNLTLGQGLWGSYPSELFDVRLRTTVTSSNGQPSLSTPAGSITPELTHVVYTRDTSGRARIYLNGVEQANRTTEGTLANWNSGYRLALGNELNGGRPWLGEFYLMAMFNRALNVDEVAQNFHAGLGGTTSQPTVPSILMQPEDRQVTAGSSVTFQVTALGTAPLSYQWQRQVMNQWVDLTEALTDSYTMTAVTLADSGSAFRCIISNTAGTVTSQTAILTVHAVNTPPVAVDDAYTFPCGETLTVDAEQGVLTNDTDAEDDPLSVNVLTPPSYGTLSLNADGSFTYIPDNDTVTNDSFTYGAQDESGEMAQATVTLTMTLTNPGQRVTDGQVVLYTFADGAGTVVHDVSEVGKPLDLTIKDASAAQWLPGGGIALHAPTMIVSASSASKITAAVKQTQEVTVEALIKPATLTQDGPARIVTISADQYARNLTLGQGLWGDSPSDLLDVRLRTTATRANGLPSLSTQAGSLDPGLVHVVYTHTVSGETHMYLNGAEQTSSLITGNLSTWNSTYRLALGNELTGDRPWLGELHLIAIFNRALSPTEVAQNFSASPLAFVKASMSSNDDSLAMLKTTSRTVYSSATIESLVTDETQSAEALSGNVRQTTTESEVGVPLISVKTVIVSEAELPRPDEKRIAVETNSAGGSSESARQITQVGEYTPVPEPSTLLLLIAGLLFMLGRTRKTWCRQK